MHRLAAALTTALVLLCAYVANGDFLPSSDAVGNTYLPISVLRDGDMLFHPDDEPAMFKWRLREGDQVRPIELRSLSEVVEGVPAAKRLGDGSLTMHEPFYYVVERPGGGYANTFGPGAGLSALPVFGAAWVVLGDELFTRHDWIWHLSKLAAALLVALSGAAVCVAASRFVSWRVAVMVALLYGLGTGVWSTSSQVLWQHGPNTLFLALGVALLAWARLERGTTDGDAAPVAWGCVVGAGAALGGAVACRPTSLLVVAVVAAWLTWRARRVGLAFMAGALPPGIALAAHNAVMYGSPLHFGQTMASVAMAEEKTGVASVWSFALWESVPGLLVSPSRGVLIYSPIVAVAAAGLVLAWRRGAMDEALAELLKPLGLAALTLWLVAFAWYDWWGGWAFGYRPLVDTMPLVCVGLAPALLLAAEDRSRRAVALGLAAFSIGVQALGAFSYSTLDWNNRPIYEVQLPDAPKPQLVVERGELEALKARGGVVVRRGQMNIDKPQNRHRLWSVVDSQLLYYAQNPVEGRRSKEGFQQVWVGLFAPRGVEGEHRGRPGRGGQPDEKK
ncbi:MAG: hypothetical protein CMH57_09725 [Myxococcales bacterium]|nr:hypothetical protein [Myxococcales bacterium]